MNIYEIDNAMFSLIDDIIFISFQLKASSFSIDFASETILSYTFNP